MFVYGNHLEIFFPFHSIQPLVFVEAYYSLDCDTTIISYKGFDITYI